MPSVNRRQSGFSLIELAVVLMIVGILTSGILVTVSQITEGNRRSTALSQLRMVEEALYGFAQLTGRLPCPAAADSNGLESPADSSGVCDELHGFVPSATLGLAGAINNAGQLLDPWQNPYRYVVHDSGTFTSAEKLKAEFASPSIIESLITLASASGCALADQVNTSIPAIIISQGANWATITSADEAENADGDYCFVTTTYSEDNCDDQLLWLSPYVLFTRMGTAGRLP